MAARDWARRFQSPTCGTRSMVNVDRAPARLSEPDIGPFWAGPGPDTCRAGKRPRGASGPLLGLGPQGWSMVDRAVRIHGSQAWSKVDRIYSLSLSLVYGAPGACGFRRGCGSSLSIAAALSPEVSSCVLVLWWLRGEPKGVYGIMR